MIEPYNARPGDTTKLNGVRLSVYRNSSNVISLSGPGVSITLWHSEATALGLTFDRPVELSDETAARFGRNVYKILAAPGPWSADHFDAIATVADNLGIPFEDEE